MSTLATKFYDGLINGNIIGQTGYINASLGGVSTSIKGIDGMGNILEEWVCEWGIANGYTLLPNPQTQKFPDVYLSGAISKNDLLEIKAFNHNNSPAFDVADFFEYVDNLEAKPYKLYANYLVLGYKMNKITGTFTIENIWLKNVWNLVGKSTTNHITCQIRSQTDGLRKPYKIRPVNVKNSDGFDSPLKFLEALQKLLDKNDITKGKYTDWLKNFKISHFKYYGVHVK